MYKNVQKIYKKPAKNIKRFGKYLKTRRKGLKVCYVLY